MKIQQIHGVSALRLVALAVLIGILGTTMPAGASVLLVSDYVNGKILEYNDATGAFQGVFTSGLVNPTSLALGPDREVYVAVSSGGAWGTAGPTTGQILRYKLDGTPDGVFISSMGAGYSVTGMDFAPNGALWASQFFPGGFEFAQGFNASGAAITGHISGRAGSAAVSAVAVYPTGGTSYDVLVTDHFAGSSNAVEWLSSTGSPLNRTNAFPVATPGTYTHSLSVAPNGKIYSGTDIFNQLGVLDLPAGSDTVSAFTTIPGLTGGNGIAAIGFDQNGNILTGTTGANSIYRTTPGGVTTLFITAGSGGLSGVGYDGILLVVPEPSTVLLMGLGSLCLWRRTRTNRPTV